MSSGDLTLATSKRMLLCRLSTICCMATISPLPCTAGTLAFPSSPAPQGLNGPLREKAATHTWQGMHCWTASLQVDCAKLFWLQLLQSVS